MDKSIIKTMVNDIIFRQHIINKNSLNILFIIIEIVTLIICNITKMEKIGTIIIETFFLLIILNNAIANYTWEKAKKELNKMFEE